MTTNDSRSASRMPAALAATALAAVAAVVAVGMREPPAASAQAAPPEKPGQPGQPSGGVTPEALAAAEKVLSDVYGKELEAVAKKPPAERVKLARKLAEAASGAAKDDPALARVLRSKAAELASADNSGLPLALELRRAQAADPDQRPAVLPELAAVLERSLKAETKPPARQKLAEELLTVYRSITEEKLSSDDAAGAMAVLAKAKSAAKAHLPPGESRETVRALETDEKECVRRKGLLEAVAREEAAVKRNPSDPKANKAWAMALLALGREDKAAAPLRKCEADPLQKLGKLLGETSPAAPDLEVAEAYRAAAEAAPVEKNLLLGLARARYEAFLAADPKHPEAARVRLLVTQLPVPAAAPEFKPNPDRLAVLSDRAFADRFMKGAMGGGSVKPEVADKAPGRPLLLKATGTAYNTQIEGWQFSIVENPTAPNEFRHLHLSYRLEKSGGANIELARSGSLFLFASLTANGKGQDVDQSVTVTRDLFKEFGAFQLTGICFKSNGLWIERLCLAKSVADIERGSGKKR